jgi:hypothetical protein
MVTVLFILILSNNSRLADSVGSLQGIQHLQEPTILFLFILLFVLVVFLFARPINLIKPLPKVEYDAAQM